MKIGNLTTLILVLLLSVGCHQAGTMKNSAARSAPAAAPNAMPTPQTTRANAQEAQVTLAKAEAVPGSVAPTNRKIIRHGELTIELDDPADAQRRITAIAESLGGFVVTTESKLNEAAAPSRPRTTISIVIRVPSAQFTTAIDKIRAVGGRVLYESLQGQDVTEEYIDLEARIRTKKALEAQFLEILKQARKVSDVLEVQEKLAEVRTEIEQLEGRRRFLENQSSLSTITITLQPPAPLVTATQSGFMASVRQAFGDGVDLAADIVLDLIRLAIISVPILGLIVLPGVLLWRLARRRFGWFRRHAAPPPAMPQ